MDFNHLAGLCQNLDTDSRGFKKYQLSSHFQGQNWKSLNLKIFLKLFSVQLVATFVPSWYKIYKERWNDGWRDENKRKPSVKLKFQNSYFEIISNRWSGTGPLSGLAPRPHPFHHPLQVQQRLFCISIATDACCSCRLMKKINAHAHFPISKILKK